jgi:hypothetical protein
LKNRYLGLIMDWNENEQFNSKQKRIVKKLDFFRTKKTQQVASQSLEEEQHWNGKLNFDFFHKSPEIVTKPSFLRRSLLFFGAVAANAFFLGWFLHIMESYYPEVNEHNKMILVLAFWFSWLTACNSISSIRKFFEYQYSDKTLLKKPLLSLALSIGTILAPGAFLDHPMVHQIVSIGATPNIQGSEPQMTHDINVYQTMHPSHYTNLQNIDLPHSDVDYPQTR